MFTSELWDVFCEHILGKKYLVISSIFNSLENILEIYFTWFYRVHFLCLFGTICMRNGHTKSIQRIFALSKTYSLNLRTRFELFHDTKMFTSSARFYSHAISRHMVLSLWENEVTDYKDDKSTGCRNLRNGKHLLNDCKPICISLSTILLWLRARLQYPPPPLIILNTIFLLKYFDKKIVFEMYRIWIIYTPFVQYGKRPLCPPPLGTLKANFIVPASDDVTAVTLTTFQILCSDM